MRSRLLIVFGLCCCMHAVSPAQNDKDKLDIYRLILKDYTDSVSFPDSVPVALVDSTKTAIFWGGFPDDVNKQYLGFSDMDLTQMGDFHWRFVDSTKNPEIFPSALYEDQELVKVSRKLYHKAFWPHHQPEKSVLTGKGFKRFSRRSGCKCFCEFSRPFFIDEFTGLVYFNYRCGMDQGMDNVYLVRRSGDQWKIIYKLRPWRL